MDDIDRRRQREPGGSWAAPEPFNLASESGALDGGNGGHSLAGMQRGSDQVSPSRPEERARALAATESPSRYHRRHRSRPSHDPRQYAPEAHHREHHALDVEYSTNAMGRVTIRARYGPTA